MKIRLSQSLFTAKVQNNEDALEQSTWINQIRHCLPAGDSGHSACDHLHHLARVCLSVLVASVWKSLLLDDAPIYPLPEFFGFLGSGVALAAIDCHPRMLSSRLPSILPKIPLDIGPKERNELRSDVVVPGGG